MPLPSSAAGLALAVCAWWVAVFDMPFLERLAEAAGPATASSLALAGGFAAALWLLYAALMCLALHPVLAKAVMAAFTAVGAGAWYFMSAYGTVIDADMVRNALATDVREASEYLSPAMAGKILLVLLPPAFMIARARLPSGLTLKRAAKTIGAALAFAAVAVAVLGAQFQGVSSLVRNNKPLRWLIAPANVIVATARTLARDSSPDKDAPRLVIDPAPSLAPTHKQPRGELLVVVVGETVRKQNWGLAGYARDTTPELARRGVIDFADVTACGTSTDVSLPCMFSRVGRADYDRKAILREESLLAVMQRAGARVLWLENQSGCKGVCQGVPYDKLSPGRDPDLCRGGECFDGAMLEKLKRLDVARDGGLTVVFLHQLGNHGPAYYKRYPAAFERFKPVCKDERLQNCSREAIVNAYDNAVLYTDSLLAGAIDWLASRKDLDTGLLYVSDHGESLGEKGLYLHGAPQLLAPDEQTRVPMTLWLSGGLKARLGLDEGCLRERAARPASHDMLFSTLLALAGVQSAAYEAAKDATAACRSPDRAAAAMRR
ncbi:MAG: sulfatase-like hydrolase/transferase [Duodenibacillus sp.]|nr:sulfatase-like hydrolase/transferase [Duodenibacillus sp.]